MGEGRRIWGGRDGAHPDKTGTDYRRDKEVDANQGPLTCGGCGGRGVVVRLVRDATAIAGEEGQENNEMKCPNCNGKGKVGG